MKKIRIRDFEIGGGAPFVLIAGPCVIESRKLIRQTASRLREIAGELGIPLVFKSSYDKANRTSVKSFRGPGLARGLEILQEVKEDFKLPVISDVHRFEEIEAAVKVLDIVQVPAFLCRQTDFIQAVAAAAKIINIKKGQFLAPVDVAHVIRKARAAGNRNILITERGSSFGYHNLVVDYRAFPAMRSFGCPVIFDATHSVQLPGGAGDASGGERGLVPCLARAAVAAGIDGVFMEVHPDPDRARCDGPNSLKLDTLKPLLTILRDIDSIVKRTGSGKEFKLEGEA
ncbi:MAG: 3-deoxy-8-phosphooctulonate synthase [Syntrophaceae bacterium]